MKDIRMLLRAATAAAAALAASAAMADITVGVSISLTGPTSALGIPTK
jgi:branched-chain amino acid transport system substrate-binding protein